MVKGLREVGKKMTMMKAEKKLHTSVPGVNCHRSVLPLEYAWASIAAHHSAALFTFISFQAF